MVIGYYCGPARISEQVTWKGTPVKVSKGIIAKTGAVLKEFFHPNRTKKARSKAGKLSDRVIKRPKLRTRLCE